jgi:pyruvate/2-oxoglutarate dehydrogenase complex dihydrolipoamide dehydrogenase (E3) component
MDVVIIGGGHAGQIIALKCVAAGLQTTIIEASGTKPDSVQSEWIPGKGVVYSKGLVAILDPETGDERRLIQSKAIVFAVGRLEPGNLIGMMLGITKLGAELTADNTAIACNDRGETRAEGIYATGSCAHASTPYIMDSLIAYCTKSLAER